MQGNAEVYHAKRYGAHVGFAAIPAQTRTWIMTFPPTAFALFALQPSATVALALAVSTSVLMAAMAKIACAPESSETGRASVSLLSPVLSVLFIIIAAYAGNAVAGDSPAASSAVAALALVGLYAVDAVITGAGLLASAKGSAAAGAPVAVLVEAKYAGLFGRLS